MGRLPPRPPAPAEPRGIATSAAPFSLTALTALTALPTTTTAPTTTPPDEPEDAPDLHTILAALVEKVGRQRAFCMVCVMTLGWTGPVAAGLLALAAGGSGVAVVVAMAGGLGLTMGAGLGGRTLAWRRLLRVGATHDVDLDVLTRAMALVEREGIDGLQALQQGLLQAPALRPVAEEIRPGSQGPRSTPSRDEADGGDTPPPSAQ